MDRETIIAKTNLDNIREVEFEEFDKIFKYDYIFDEKGNNILPVSIIEMKLLERIKILEERLTQLEEVNK